MRDDVRMARPRRACRQRAEAARQICPVRRRETLRHRDGAGGGQPGVRMWRHPARAKEAGRVQAVRHRLHAGDADRAPAWSPRRAPAPRTGPMAGFASSGRSGRGPAGGARPSDGRQHESDEARARPIAASWTSARARRHEPWRRRTRHGRPHRRHLPPGLRQRVAGPRQRPGQLSGHRPANGW